MARKYGAQLHIHGTARGIGSDWNIALAQSDTEWTTIAHQDDVYHPDYTRRIVDAGKGVQNPLIVFCEYVELRADSHLPASALLRAKRLLLELGFLGRSVIRSASAKSRALRFGCSIPCPAVTFHRNALRLFSFREDLKVSLDWAAWLELAAQPGAFVWVREILMEHRIHDTSATSSAIDDGTRKREDFEILSHLWPRGVARLILSSYEIAYRRGRLATPRR